MDAAGSRSGDNEASSASRPFPTVSTLPSHISFHHDDEPIDGPSESSHLLPSGLSSQPGLNGSHYRSNVQPDELEDAESDDGSEFEAFMQQGTINVGQPWDESSDEDDEHDEVESTHALSNRRGKRRSRDLRNGSVLNTIRPLRERRRAWWKLLTNPKTPASLSAPHVAANLFASSLHPSVLLSMPHYFARTGVPLGMIAMAGVAILGGVGGGLWVVLSRYVNGTSVEAIVGASFGRYTRWKGGMGRAVSGLLLATYATGSAFVAYFGLADLLLQVFFYYSPKGIPLHDRAFVTLVVGAITTAPFVIFPLAKRNLIRLSTFFAVALYPIITGILLFKVLSLPVAPDSLAADLSSSKPHHDPPSGWPNVNPFRPPSIWAAISLLPLLTLSTSPLQILAHQRSLRRIGTSRSNVKAFMAAQATQVLCIIGFGAAFGIGIGVKGLQGRMGKASHPNLFASLPNDDHLVNAARVMFIVILATHLSLCLVTARSSWGRLLRLLNLNPLRKRTKPAPARTVSADDRPSSSLLNSQSQPQLAEQGQLGQQNEATQKKGKRKWGKLARNTLAGMILWSISAFGAYLSGAGGFRRVEKEGEEARFTRASEILGLFGAAVGFVMPGLVWLVLFHIRRPRAILPLFASELGRTASEFFAGPQSILALNRARIFGESQQAAERRPLLGDMAEQDENEDETAEAPDRDRIPSVKGKNRLSGAASLAPSEHAESIPSHITEQSSDDRDEATTILLARKERQLQRRTRGKRLYQDVIVFAAVLPFGFALLVLGAIELRKGRY